MSSRLLVGLLVLVLGAWLFQLFAAGRGIPFLADDYDHLQIAAAMQSPLEAFARGHTSPKPLHHLIFYWGAHCTGPSPAWMRVPAFLAHAAALFFVHRLARQLGATPAGAAVATVLYAAFPTVRSLLWPVAISGFVRVTFALAALSFWLDVGKRRWAGAATVASACLAMLAHQSGALTPVFLVLWSALAPAANAGARVRQTLVAARHPVVLLSAAAVLGYVWWASGTADHYRNVLPWGAIAANALRSLVALLPDVLRMAAVDAFRGQGGFPARALGGVGVLLAAAFFCWRLVKGGPVWRFALVAGALDLTLAIVTAGYSQRYAYLLAALFCVAVGTSCLRGSGSPAREGLPLAAVAILFCAWCAETRRVVGELREAGEIADTVLAQVTRASSEMPAQAELVLANVPDVWGKEQDLPLFNWGLKEALEMRGVRRQLRQIRTVPARTSTAATLVEASALNALRAGGDGTLLEFDRAKKRLVLWRAGEQQEQPR